MRIKTCVPELRLKCTRSAKVFVSPPPTTLLCHGQESASTPLLRPFGRQPKTEISFGLCYNNDVKNGRLVGRPPAPRSLRMATPPLKSLLLRANTPRASRVVKELMAALMRFPAAVYQVSFVNVAPSFLPSFLPGAERISILGWS